MRKLLKPNAKGLKSYGGGASHRKSSSIIAGQFSHFFFALLVLLTLGSGNAWAVDWAQVGTTALTDNAEYYIYNVSTQKFLSYTYDGSTATPFVSAQVTDAKWFKAVPKVVAGDDNCYNLISTDNDANVTCALMVHIVGKLVQVIHSKLLELEHNFK